MTNRALVLLMIAACGPAIAPLPVQIAPGPAPVTSVSASAACADDYVPAPPWSGRKADLPQPPAIAVQPEKSGDSFTVHGAVHLLNSRFQEGELAHDIKITGYIVDTNLARAPKCALHRTGVADAPGCTSAIPSFTIADARGATAGERITVMGWASNFANVFEANQKYLKASQRPAQLYTDELWTTEVPYPLPSVGAKVTLTGRYGFSFGMSSAGISTDPVNGILTVKKTEYLEPAPSPAAFPQLP